MLFKVVSCDAQEELSFNGGEELWFLSLHMQMLIIVLGVNCLTVVNDYIAMSNFFQKAYTVICKANVNTWQL